VRGFALVQPRVARGRQGYCDSNEREWLEAHTLVAAIGVLITVGFAHGRGCVATFMADDVSRKLLLKCYRTNSASPSPRYSEKGPGDELQYRVDWGVMQ
jgi:hypothetical protein